MRSVAFAAAMVLGALTCAPLASATPLYYTVYNGPNTNGTVDLGFETMAPIPALSDNIQVTNMFGNYATSSTGAVGGNSYPYSIAVLSLALNIVFLDQSANLNAPGVYGVQLQTYFNPTTLQANDTLVISSAPPGSAVDEPSSLALSATMVTGLLAVRRSTRRAS